MYPYQNPVNDFYMNNARQPQQQWLPFPPPQPQIPQVITKFVSNIEEAKAAIADPLSILIFVDSANGKIYVKKMGDKGLSEFYIYAQEEAPKDPYIEINNRLSRIENVIGGLVNDKSVSNVSGSQQSESISQSAITESNESNGSAEPSDVSKVAGDNKWKNRR